jgi:hypothetical protein
MEEEAVAGAVVLDAAARGAEELWPSERAVDAELMGWVSLDPESYDLAVYESGGAGLAATRGKRLALIPVVHPSDIDSCRCVVALPASTWARRVADRPVAQELVLKSAQCQVSAAEESGEVAAGPKIAVVLLSVAVAFLAMVKVATLHEEYDYVFTDAAGESRLPHGEELQRAAWDKLGLGETGAASEYLSAEDRGRSRAVPRGPRATTAPVATADRRLDAMEAALAEMKELLLAGPRRARRRGQRRRRGRCR